MVERERTVRIDLTYGELEAVAWAIWFGHPSARQEDVVLLDAVSQKVLVKRRQLRTTGLPDPEPPHPVQS